MGWKGGARGVAYIRLHISEVEGGLMHQEAFNLNTQTYTHPCQILIVVLKSQVNPVIALLPALQ